AVIHTRGLMLAPVIEDQILENFCGSVRIPQISSREEEMAAASEGSPSCNRDSTFSSSTSYCCRSCESVSPACLLWNARNAASRSSTWFFSESFVKTPIACVSRKRCSSEVRSSAGAAGWGADGRACGGEDALAGGELAAVDGAEDEAFAALDGVADEAPAALDAEGRCDFEPVPDLAGDFAPPPEA